MHARVDVAARRRVDASTPPPRLDPTTTPTDNMMIILIDPDETCSSPAWPPR
jgi:hypothetical protein